MTRTAVIAIGGNSLIKDRQHERIADQYQACVETCRHIAPLLRDPDLRLVITHGNGPQVGFTLRRSELASGEVPSLPLDSCVAGTQGGIGYHIQLALANEFRRLNVVRTAVSIVTMSLVDANDRAFLAPDKPIGSFLTKEEAEHHRRIDRWNVVEDAGRGWRRVVASPRPTKILEVDAIRALLDRGFVVIAAGGGGIAVVEDPAGGVRGAEAVIDKDLASSLLARQLGADLLVISTAVENVFLAFGTAQQRAIDRMTAAEAHRYMQAGHFKAGSMLPKIEAAMSFVESGCGDAVITDPPHLEAALDGAGGTRITLAECAAPALSYEL
ncbi:MAG TPA: carbamate kinase [Thermoanaerobaculia bacterium]